MRCWSKRYSRRAPVAQLECGHGWRAPCEVSLAAAAPLPESGCDPVRAATSAGAADGAPFNVERSRCAPTRKSGFTATSSGHASQPRVRGACKARGAAHMSIWASRATPQTPFLAATLWDGALFAHSGVARRSFGMTKRRSSRLGLREKSRRRTRGDY